MLGKFLKKLTVVRVLFWIALIAVGVVFLTFQVRSRITEAAANIKSLEITEETRYPVTFKRLTPAKWESWKSYYGQAKAARTQDVTSYVRELVNGVHVQVGDRVKIGQTVVTLSKADYTAKAQASKTGYEEALLNYNRLLELSKKGGISQSEVDRAYSALKNEESNAQASKSTLQRTELTASINGIVSSRNVEPGEVAEAGKSLITILDLAEMEAQLMVSKKDINAIDKDTPVDIVVDGNVSKGRVKRLSPEAQTGSGLYPVTVSLSADSGILPGTYLEGRFMVERKNDVIAIPSNIVVYRGEKQFAYVADGGKAKMIEITTGEGRNGEVVVTSGLNIGDDLIVSGNRTLFDGALISRDVAAETK